MDLNRRAFLFGAGALAGLGLPETFAAAPVPSRRGFQPGDRIRHACIGVGGMGYHDFQQFKGHPNLDIVAVCDVDSNHLAKAGDEVPGAKRYADWRELLDKEGDNIDSVNIAVPDHSHAVIALAAMAKGKHVYCQKPLCHDVAECRAVALAAQKYGVVTQLGTQMAATGGDRLGVSYLRSGIIGEVRKVYLCSNRTGAEFYRLKGPRPAPNGTKPPANLAWNLWLGTAPEREYAPDIYHTMKWRSWQDFGTGWSGDIGCHIFDPVWKGLDLGAAAPKTVRAEVQASWKADPARFADTWPQSNHITWEFDGIPATGGKPFTMEWFDGEFYPHEDGQALVKAAGFEKYPEECALVFGSEGAVLIHHCGLAYLLPKDKFAMIKRPRLGQQNHYHNFVNACLGGAPCESYFQRTGPMAETIILGTVAIRRPDVTLKWNASALAFDGDEAATRLLRRTYRQGW